ncbi:MAG: type II secretion system protein GspG [Phycisphaerae bacterium]|jgi:prepilin-type N-terminal cleavage/methylation domain-containing protein|nr:type II secretion system protein GspG [Phycisphaerae bacterium]
MTTRTYKTNAVRTRGFTLVELLAVMLILTVLMTLVAGAAWLLFNDVYVDETKNTMNIAMTAITEYYQVNKAYPNSGDGWVTQLLTVPKSRALLAKFDKNIWSPTDNTHLKDAWGNPIKYLQSGGLAGAPGLISGGPDGDTDTEEDNVRYNR